jgi:nucleotide-binding universal stress UspA family protein
MIANGRSIGRIVVGVDGSRGSAAALRWASELALAEDAELVVVHVVEPASYDTAPVGLPRAVLNEADWRQAIHDELEGTWCAPLTRAGVRHRVRVEEGDAGPRLVAIAGEEHAGLVVTGHRGPRGLAELVQGGVSAFVTHHSPCPVAVVPAERQAA